MRSGSGGEGGDLYSTITIYKDVHVNEVSMRASHDGECSFPLTSQNTNQHMRRKIQTVGDQSWHVKEDKSPSLRAITEASSNGIIGAITITTWWW